MGMAYLLFKVHIWVRVDAGFFFAYFIEFCAYCFRNPTARVRYSLVLTQILHAVAMSSYLRSFYSHNHLYRL